MFPNKEQDPSRDGTLGSGSDKSSKFSGSEPDIYGSPSEDLGRPRSVSEQAFKVEYYEDQIRSFLLDKIGKFDPRFITRGIILNAALRACVPELNIHYPKPPSLHPAISELVQSSNLRVGDREFVGRDTNPFMHDYIMQGFLVNKGLLKEDLCPTFSCRTFLVKPYVFDEMFDLTQGVSRAMFSEYDLIEPVLKGYLKEILTGDDLLRYTQLLGLSPLLLVEGDTFTKVTLRSGSGRLLQDVGDNAQVLIVNPGLAALTQLERCSRMLDTSFVVLEEDSWTREVLQNLVLNRSLSNVLVVGEPTLLNGRFDVALVPNLTDRFSNDPQHISEILEYVDLEVLYVSGNHLGNSKSSRIFPTPLTRLEGWLELKLKLKLDNSTSSALDYDPIFLMDPLARLGVNSLKRREMLQTGVRSAAISFCSTKCFRPFSDAEEIAQ